MPFTKRQIWAAIVLTVGGLSGIVGLLVGVPQLITTYAHQVPVWLRNPNVWWVVLIAIVTVIADLLILAPWKKTPPKNDDNLRLGPRFMVEDHLMGLIDRTIRRAELAVDQDHMRTSIMHSVEQDIPTLLETVLGKRDKAKYMSVISDAKSKDDDPGRLLRTATTYLTGLWIKRVDDKLALMRAESPTSD